MDLRCGASVISVACTPTVDVVVAGSVDRQVYRFAGESLDRKLTRLLDHEVWAVDVDSTGQIVAAGTASKKPAAGALYVLSSELEVLYKESLGAPVWGVSVSPSGSYIAATTWAGLLRVYLWQPEGRYNLILSEQVANASDGLYGVAVDEFGTVAVAVYNNGLRVYASANILLTMGFTTCVLLVAALLQARGTEA
jgi:WD40 repeat protein